MHVLVTGSTGFIGPTLCGALADAGHTVRVALRRDGQVPSCVAERVIVGDIAAPTDWATAVTGVDSVIHAAARAHVLGDHAVNAPLYEKVNALATRQLAEAAALAGVRRFVYLSSIKVNGEETGASSFTPFDPPLPRDAYGMSKLHGEQAVFEVSSRTGMQTAVVRPPLVYGPGVRANFLRLLRWVDRGWPLPLGSVHNRRSLVSVWNLCDLLVRLLKDPMTSARAWLVSDSEDVSTADLLLRIGVAMGRRVRLAPVPVAVLQSVAALLGRKAEVTRLCGSLTVDISQTRDILGWSPPVTLDQGLERTVRWYLSLAHQKSR